MRQLGFGNVTKTILREIKPIETWDQRLHD
jgi:hypothetical protein